MRKETELPWRWHLAEQRVRWAFSRESYIVKKLLVNCLGERCRQLEWQMENFQ